MSNASTRLTNNSSELAGAGKKRQAHRLYHPHQSSSAKKVDHARWKISYGDGSSASGNVWTDNIRVAGVHLHNQAIEVAQQLSSAFLTDGGNDGLLGLAFPKLNTVEPHRVATPVENMIKQRLIDPVSYACARWALFLPLKVRAFSRYSLANSDMAPSRASTRLVRCLNGYVIHLAYNTSDAGFIDHSVTKHEIVYHHVDPYAPYHSLSRPVTQRPS